MHVPVLQKEVLQYLAPKANENFIDATIGEAGHTLAILEKTGPKGKVLGIELDPELYKKIRKKFERLNLKGRLVLVNDSYCNLKEIVAKKNFEKVSGILFDLGLCSWHLEKSGRGFSFQRNEPLIMSYFWKKEENSLLYSKTFSGEKLSARKIVNEWPKEKIERILKEYGQERFARKITKEIIVARKIKPIETTFQLVEIIKKAVPKNYERGRIHPATRTFQALRIAVNDELNNLEKSLPQALEILEPSGRLVVISFHSLEDRIVKNFFRENFQKKRLKILTKKTIGPSEKELKINPRSRSAKLRAAEKL